jgi:hypothetical protein
MYWDQIKATKKAMLEKYGTITDSPMKQQSELRTHFYISYPLGLQLEAMGVEKFRKEFGGELSWSEAQAKAKSMKSSAAVDKTKPRSPIRKSAAQKGFPGFPRISSVQEFPAIWPKYEKIFKDWRRRLSADENRVIFAQYYRYKGLGDRLKSQKKKAFIGEFGEMSLWEAIARARAPVARAK